MPRRVPGVFVAKASPHHRINCSKGSGSIGRASVSKTGGWGFESLLPCEVRCDRAFDPTEMFGVAADVLWRVGAPGDVETRNCDPDEYDRRRWLRSHTP